MDKTVSKLSGAAERAAGVRRKAGSVLASFAVALIFSGRATPPFPAVEGAEGAAGGPGPRIHCAGAMFDFGRAIKGRTVKHVFVLENRGGAPLRILSVTPSCSCTTAPVSRDLIAPGGRAELDVSVDTSEFDGFVQKAVSVASDDPERPLLMLEFKGVVSPLVEAVPSPVDIRRVSRHMNFEMPVRLRCNDGCTPEVLSTTVEGEPFLEASTRKDPATGETVVHLKLKRGAEPHSVSGALSVGLDSAEMPVLRVRVTGQILDDVSAFPARLSFGTLARGDPFPRPVLAIVVNPSVRIDGVSFEPPLFDVTTAPRAAMPASDNAQLPEPAGVEIRVSVRVDAPPGEVKGKIRIRTTSLFQREIVIPIEGVVAGGGGKP